MQIHDNDLRYQQIQNQMMNMPQWAKAKHMEMSVPEKELWRYSEERDGTIYVGFRFSAVFGFFETGDFDVTIPVKGEISEVVLKTSMNESTLWERETGFFA